MVMMIAMTMNDDDDDDMTTAMPTYEYDVVLTSSSCCGYLGNDLHYGYKPQFNYCCMHHVEVTAADNENSCTDMHKALTKRAALGMTVLKSCEVDLLFLLQARSKDHHMYSYLIPYREGRGFAKPAGQSGTIHTK